MVFKEELTSILKEKRPNLRDSSIKLYVNNMNKLSKLLEQPDFKNVDFLNNKESIEKALEGKSNHTIKTYYASIVVVMMALGMNEDIINKYRDDMEALQENYKNMVDTQKKTEKQEKNWLSYDELVGIMNKLRKKVNYEGILKKDTLSRKEFDLLQQHLVASLYLLEPDSNPPIRLDYAPMKIISHKDYESIKEPNENYLVIKSRNHKYFAFNDYKTSRSYNEKKIKVGSKLNTVINNWLRYNKSGYLLLNAKDEPLSSNGLTKFINKIFNHTGKKVSVSMIRHAYLSNRYEADNEDKKKIAEAMLHSTNQQTEYIKEE
jgi:integrase